LAVLLLGMAEADLSAPPAMLLVHFR